MASFVVKVRQPLSVLEGTDNAQQILAGRIAYCSQWIEWTASVLSVLQQELLPPSCDVPD